MPSFFSKSRGIALIVLAVLVAIGAIFYVYQSDASIRRGIDTDGKSRVNTEATVNNQTAQFGRDNQAAKNSTQEINVQCLSLPHEIDPANDKLMSLSRICNSQNAQNKDTPHTPVTFQMPNLIWHERVLVVNGKKLTYKFGDGNPPEVALKPSAYDGSIGKYEDYVTPAVEQNLYQVLSDSALKNMADHCGMGINSVLSTDQNSSVLGSAQLNIENFLKIDESTGRKYLNYSTLMALNSIFTNLDSSLAANEHEKLKYQCLGGIDLYNFETLYKNFGQLMNSYINIDLAGAYSAGDPKNPDKADIEEYLRVTGKSQHK